VRGYLEAATVGDNAIVGSLELRSPSLFWWNYKKKEGIDADKDPTSEWRLFAFIDGGIAKLKDPLPEQISDNEIWSYGVGTTIRLFDYLSGTILVGVPMIDLDTNKKNDPFVSFQVSADL
jgi:hemolysin activation/secretion protein